VNLQEAAAAARELAGRAEASLAHDCAEAAAKEYLAALFVTTPVLTGALRATERINDVTGGGAVAVADVGPHIVYDKFRNDGGTITSHGPWPLRNRATGRVFGHSVTQRGSHYMERAEAEAEGTIQASMGIILDGFLTL
jgi:hypothetical protein